MCVAQLVKDGTETGALTPMVGIPLGLVGCPGQESLLPLAGGRARRRGATVEALASRVETLTDPLDEGIRR
jgi:hypothetical protein